MFWLFDFFINLERNMEQKLREIKILKNVTILTKKLPK